MPSIFFNETGSGPPIVFLHGFCETHEIWEEFIKPFAGKFRVILPDLPGCGHSEILATPFTIDQVGDSVVNWLNDLKIRQCILIGHSLGGYVALSIADRHPHVLKGFGLFHSTASPDSQEKKDNRNKVIDSVTRNGVQPFVDILVPGLFFDKSNPDIPATHRIASQTKANALIGYAMAMRDRPDRSFVLSKNKVPKLLIAGMEDTVVPLENSRQMAEISENCSFFVLPNTGHMGFFEAKSESQMITTSFAEQVFFNN